MPKTNQRKVVTSEAGGLGLVIMGILGILAVVSTIALALVASEALYHAADTRLPGWVIDIGAVSLTLFIIAGALKKNSEGNSNE